MSTAVISKYTITDLQYIFPSLSCHEAYQLQLMLHDVLLDKLVERVRDLDSTIDGLHHHIALMETES